MALGVGYLPALSGWAKRADYAKLSPAWRQRTGKGEQSMNRAGRFALAI